MISRVSDYDLIIIGAGAAGIGAGRAALRSAKPLRFLILEAAHRTGGRGLTEELAPGIPLDLGCHWMHSADINPFVTIADELGFSYGRDYFPINFFLGKRWATPQENQDYLEYRADYYRRIEDAAQRGQDISVFDATARDSRWTAYFDYWNSLMTSAVPDQVSIFDYTAYHDTGEN
jgi:monoamine oxidase